MTVEPLILHWGPLAISAFGLLMLVGFLAGTWTYRLELRRRGLPTSYAWDIFIAAGIGGLLGAKLWHVAVAGDLHALLDRGGMVWWGGLLGGFLAVIGDGHRRGVPMRFTLEIVGPGLALAYAIGRVGCFLVGDDYGVPSSLPWAVKFPHGLPPSTGHYLSRLFGVELPPGTRPDDVLAVHPTQLYEAAAMLVVFWLLWRLRKRPHGDGWLFGAYLALAGVERFLVEFVRLKDDRLFGPISLAQVTAVAALVIGCMLMARWPRPDPAIERRAAEVLG